MLCSPQRAGKLTATVKTAKTNNTCLREGVYTQMLAGPVLYGRTVILNQNFFSNWQIKVWRSPPC